MEPNEAQELQENAEHGEHESSLRPVAFTMSVLAVLVAVVTVLGHRTHTEAILDQNKATDQWNYYQAHKIRSNDTALAADNLKEEQDQAEQLEKKVEQAEERADHFDLSEALLEIGLVITSITLLTRSRIYWYLGLVFSLGGIASAVSVLFLK